MKAIVKNITRSILFGVVIGSLYIIGIDFMSQLLFADDSMENVAGLSLLILGVSGIPWSALTAINLALPNTFKYNNKDSDPKNGF